MMKAETIEKIGVILIILTMICFVFAVISTAVSNYGQGPVKDEGDGDADDLGIYSYRDTLMSMAPYQYAQRSILDGDPDEDE